ncbi:putative hydro-lyase [Campylobacter sp. MIT 99-7217]|uniref:putative hydro-lyase n=1 Tax=Campylobacter sp. MIT 99-7217 TaxID=535091 RepID=UPI001158FB75|nr:putative hydro-lyase [Campylobacter sp. MIT 99-7217]TQR33795.1 putative hydro-lyase [Campylobacter sp. MIT 99-7217]
MNPKELREKIAKQELKAQTSGMALGYAQANLVILSKEYAKDFEEFCKLNAKACPLLEIVEGKFTQKIAHHANIYTDIPKYFIYENGVKTREEFDVSKYYSDDLVGFLLGCSFSFEEALQKEGLELRHISFKRNVSMYKTNIQCKKAGIFHGEMVVSMRPFSPKDAQKAYEITKAFPKVHGEPIQIGDAQKLGIKDIYKPDFGDVPVINEGEIPVFWACGVTPQIALMNAKLPFAITHAPGFMFISDVLNEDLMYKFE